MADDLLYRAHDGDVAASERFIYRINDNLLHLTIASELPLPVVTRLSILRAECRDTLEFLRGYAACEELKRAQSQRRQKKKARPK